MRFSPFLLLFFLFSASLSADALSSRLRLLLPGDDAPTVNERQFLYQRISLMFLSLENDKVARKSTKKKIRRITTAIHRGYLRKYATDARLADAFRTGSYNDATAALLTALAFEHFEVDYEGYVDHWETYLIADPDKRADEIHVPVHKRHDAGREAAFRKDYLELLRATILEDAPAMSAAKVDKLFERYYYPPGRKLSFGQLSAFLQYRRAQAAYRAEEYQVAVNLLETAMTKEERPAFLVLRKAAELQLKATTAPEVEGDIPTLFAQWREMPDNKYLPAAILQHFDEIQRLLLAEDRLIETDELLADYLAKAPEGKVAWIRDMTDLQRYRLLRHHFTNGRPDLARRQAEDLFAQEPENESLKYILGEIIIDELRRTRAKGAEFSKAVEAAAVRYPFIRTQERFADLHLRELAWKVRDDYERDDTFAGAESLSRFRAALIDIAIDEDRSVWTLTAFIAASNYYFRLEDYAQARFFVDEGLRYNANDQYLLHRRDLLAKY